MMTPNQMIGKTREELNAMADRCRDMAADLEELADGLPYVPAAAATLDAPMQGFGAVSKMLHGGERPTLGQIVHTTLTDGRVAKWRVIDTNSLKPLPESGICPVVAQLLEIMEYRPFSISDKAHPWGWNNYDASDLADWLDETMAKDLLQPDDFHCLVRRADLGEKRRHLWLLSADEAGFGDLEKAFDWYACEDEDERDKRRQLKDSDGDPARWWLRTPYSGNAYYVRIVYTSGALNSNIAYYALGVAPACIIG